MIEVIEHLDDPIKAMSQLKHVLKDDGMIFLSTPVGKLEESATNAYDTLSHLHFFTERSLNLTLTKSGFSEIYFKYYPEMYPLPSQNVVNKPKNLVKDLVKKALLKSSPAIVNKLMNLAKNLVKNALLKSSSANGIGHLVGLTRPIGDKPTAPSPNNARS